MNYRELHKTLTIQTQMHTLDEHELERIKQRLHYIETEFDYRPRYKRSDLRPRCSNSKPKHNPKHKRS